VWALQNYGFKVIIGSRFGDIFRSNSGKAGLVIATVPQETVEKLWDYADANPGAEIEVSLVDKTITAGDDSYPFTIDDYTRHRLLEGLDDIGLTLQHADLISAYEAGRPSFLPRTLPVRAAG
jgi:3-isopropylmalate/(R)-2-methylmalate dehydratase small subunit